MNMNMNEIHRAGKRVMQFLWDTPPKNEDDSPIWCLGQRYDSHPLSVPTKPEAETTSSSSSSSVISTAQPASTRPTHSQSSPATTEDESFEKVQVQDAGPDDGWPVAFLDDFESKIWLTYRSDFPPIPKSTAPNAMSSMSWSTKLKMMAQKEGFTTDSGWGCMIRSGQSLLANTLALLELGRGSSLTLFNLNIHHIY